MLSDYFKSQDQLGPSIGLKHRGEMSHGTTLGGCLSLVLSLFITLFMLAQGVGWYMEPSFAQTRSKTFSDKAEIYTIPTTHFMPVLQILSVPGDGSPAMAF